MAHALQFLLTMPTTKPTFSSFDSLATADLASVQGGCGKKQQCCPAPQPAPAPAPAPAPPQDLVSTNVQISGYGS